MNALSSTTPKSRGYELDDSSDAFGSLTEAPSRDASRVKLLETLDEHGYLFVRDLFAAAEVLQVRNEICKAMSESGMLDPENDPIDCVPKKEKLIRGNDSTKGSSTFDAIPEKCPGLKQLLYGDETKSFFEKLFGGNVRHFDLTWFRGIAPGYGTVPHCDIVYMGRGTHDLLTCWVPYGNISLEMGGLMVLEGSTNEYVQNRIENYLSRDVDEYCENRPLPDHIDLDSKTDNTIWNGWLAANPVSLRKNLGGRWLTTEYRPGDALVFSCKLVHASLDNQSNAFRLSSDCRYQRADEPIDERFVGPGPYGHVGSAKRGRVC